MMYWANADGDQTVALAMAGGNVTQHIGEESYFRIKASAAITKGQLVMATGAVGTSGTITGAPSQGLTDGIYVIGVAAEDIALNDFGYVNNFGLVRNINTSGNAYGETWVDGDILYYNPDYVGGLTKVKPEAPNPKVVVAMVIKAMNSNSGSIFVRVSSGSVLGGTDSNVQIGTLSNSDFLVYNETLQYWENLTVAEVAAIFDIQDTPAYNEGVEITPDIASVDFVGDGVTATSDINGNVTVHVPGASYVKYNYTVASPILVDTNISLPSTPKANSLVVYIVTGPMMTEGALDDYFITTGTSTLTLLAASQLVQTLGAGDRIVIQYCV
jgi:hypothetical protein